MQTHRMKLPAVLLAAAMMVMASLANAEERLKPFTLAAKGAGDVTAMAAEVKQKLDAAGFEVVGEYSPYANAHIIVVTNDSLKRNAAQSEQGGYGAGQRVAITEVADEVQVAYTNPVYWANAYRMADDLSDVAAQLEKALGKVEDFGSEKGLTARKLRKYHYMFGMEYFDEPSELAKYENHQAALRAVEAGLAAGKGGVTRVYRIDVPGKDETVFGVAMDNTVDCSGDAYIMDKIDFKPLRSTPHLPYEMLVSGDEVYALYARFRIAISFPDLSMMGSNSFMSIMCAPKAIETALKAAAGNAGDEEDGEDED